MFDRLIDIIVGFWQSLLPWTIVKEFERGVVLRFGKFNRLLAPGFRFLIPFVEEALIDNVVLRTNWTSPQTLTTADNQTVTIKTVITWSITDIKKALLEVDGIDDAIKDSYIGSVGEAVSKNRIDDLNNRSFLTQLKRECQKRAARYGVTIDTIQIAELTPCTALRLIQN